MSELTDRQHELLAMLEEWWGHYFLCGHGHKLLPEEIKRNQQGYNEFRKLIENQLDKVKD